MWRIAQEWINTQSAPPMKEVNPRPDHTVFREEGTLLRDDYRNKMIMCMPRLPGQLGSTVLLDADGEPADVTPEDRTPAAEILTRYVRAHKVFLRGW